MEMTQIKIIRSWPGVTNGQVVAVHPIRAKRLIASGMARQYRKPGRKKKVVESGDES